MSRSGSNTGFKLAKRMSYTVLTICINIVFYALVVYGIKALALYSYNFAYQVFGDVRVEEPERGMDVKITILSGEDSFSIASKLEDAKIITDRYSFFVKTKCSDYDIKAGTYILNTSMTYSEVLDTITDASKAIDTVQTKEEIETAL